MLGAVVPHRCTDQALPSWTTSCLLRRRRDSCCCKPSMGRVALCQGSCCRRGMITTGLSRKKRSPADLHRRVPHQPRQLRNQAAMAGTLKLLSRQG